MTNRKNIRVVLTVLLCLWMALIFFFSAQDSSRSSKVSGGFTKTVITLVYRDFDGLSDEQQAEIIRAVSHFVRKTAHFMEFFILGAIAFMLLRTFDGVPVFIGILAPLAFSAFYAVTDEIHQYFVSGRACRVSDMLLDTVGAFTSIMILFIFSNFKKLRKEEN